MFAPYCARFPKLQSWSDKVVNAISTTQIDVDVQHKCSCTCDCYTKFRDSYLTTDDCKEALLQLRIDHTEGKASDEAQCQVAANQAQPI